MAFKKVAIASGKGGVGKTMLVSSLAISFARDKNRVIAVDCDVDASNLAVWLGDTENWKKIKKISISEKPLVNSNKLSLKESKECAKKCRFGALKIRNNKLEVNSFLCEGCGACEFFCPKGTIKMKSVKSGEIKIKQTKYGFPLVAGQLYPGEAGSGKLVTEVKKEAEKFDGNLMLVDSAPGTGCPVTASLQDANFALLVTEPTPSGFSDLKRVLEVVEHFGIPWRLVLNKYDINIKLTNKIRKWAGKKIIGAISYDKNIFKSISNLIPVMESSLPTRKEIRDIYHSLLSLIF